eukprot:21109-Heterococcus_DN1.PRE.2
MLTIQFRRQHCQYRVLTRVLLYLYAYAPCELSLYTQLFRAPNTSTQCTHRQQHNKHSTLEQQQYPGNRGVHCCVEVATPTAAAAAAQTCQPLREVESASVLLPGLHLIGHLADGHAVPAWHKAGQPVIERAFNEGVLQVVLGAQLAAHAGDAVAAAAAGQAPVHAYVLADVAHDDAAAAGCLDAHLRRERERDKPRQAHSASEFFSQQLSMCGKGERRWSQAHKARAQQHNAEKNCTGDTATCMPHC